ncbi:MAG: phosphoenolpyruvate synthase [bacterium]
MPEGQRYIRWLEELDSDQVDRVGGKNASLGEMLSELEAEGIRVPGGFATTAEAYRRFLEENRLEGPIREALERFEEDPDALPEVGETIRGHFLEAAWPEEVEEAIRGAYEELSERAGSADPPIAARSSATAEDLPEASFAGQQETYLNIRGADEVLDACRRCLASLFTDRAISYRQEQGFGHLDVALSVGVQRMADTNRGGAGVAFTLDTRTGFPEVVVINAGWGLGENVVAGKVNPDAYQVFKPALEKEGTLPIIKKKLGEKGERIVLTGGAGEEEDGSGEDRKAGEDREPTRSEEVPEEERARFVLGEEEIVTLGRWAVAIERHYGRPMDIEWAWEGPGGDLYILQARPETVQSQKEQGKLRTYRLTEEGEVVVTGEAIGDGAAAGKAFVLLDLEDADRFEEGGILVTDMTDPDWVPLMEAADGIVTDQGGRTSHAAIVSRELGVPAVIGTSEGTERIGDGDPITLSCISGEEGKVYEGELAFESEEIDTGGLPELDTRIMVNLASPAGAFRWWDLPVSGIGLARMEFIINNIIQIHPLALTRFEEVEEEEVREAIEERTRGYEDRTEYFVEHLARGIARIAASQYPDPAIVRLSDFKSNEYADLIGGHLFEPAEANPMLGFRGASRYVSEEYRDGFDLECRALMRARTRLGLGNIVVLVPFCRTLEEADGVLEAMAEEGLEQGEEGLEVYVMAEIPSNIRLADGFAERFDGFSIGTNDLTQLILGVDRDSEALAHLFDERNEAVRSAVRELIDRAHARDRPVGICGQAPSDHPEFAEFLVECGIDSISVNPDSVMQVREHVARAEEKSG